MSAYVIYLAEILDPDGYLAYKERVEPNILAAGGTYVIRGGDVDLLEGTLPAERTVILEFPSRHAALAWYRSDEYRDIKKLREGTARATVYIVVGVSEPR
jgi:uncharacterized protein (DUF1330 family)